VDKSIALMTDFGNRDPFVGVMKGVIASRAPKARVVDLCHGIEPGDIPAAALALKASVPYFPKGTLFVTVVDPGVGSRRRIVFARTMDHAFLAPDNGVLSWLPGKLIECRAVTNTKLFLSPVSGTFHGRDIFAPVAAALMRSSKPALLGPRIADMVRMPWPSNRLVSFDRFGNALTSVPAKGTRSILYKGRSYPVRTHYAAVASGQPLAVAGSSGLVELSVRDGDFRARFHARPGDKVHAR
jgi:S-adenosyl-L-methionine hydrolase (adenosine-forming)